MIPPKKYSSHRSRQIRRQDLIAKGVILGLSFMVIVILVWILSYLLYKGFWYDREREYKVLPYEESVLPLGEEGIIFVTPQKNRSRDLTVASLRKLYNKRRRENWGFYNQEDLKVQPFALEDGTPWGKEVETFLLLGEEEGTLQPYVRRVSGWEEMARQVATNKGGLGYLPASWKDRLPPGLKILQIRRVTLAVNPEVMAVVNNQALRKLGEEALERLLEGKVENWQDLGGRNLPVRALYYPFRGNPSQGGEPLSEEEVISALAETPGAYALLPYSLVSSRGLQSLSVDRRERGWNLNWRFIFEPPARSGQWGGISYIIVNTFVLLLFTLLFATPVGILAALYMVEYTKDGPLLRLMRAGTETLAGIPSIIFGLFGLVFFVQILGLGIGFASATLTVTLMILPIIIRTTEESLRALPDSLREGSLALGATRLETSFKVVLPAASRGILAGTVLALGRTVGETAVLLYTLGSNYDLVSGPSSSARVLSLHLYMLFSEALSMERTFATGAVLIMIILFTNLLTAGGLRILRKKTGV